MADGPVGEDVSTVVVNTLGGSPPRIGFRGWRVVVGAFITSMVGFGAIYSYGAFSANLAATFHLSTASTSIILSLSTGTTFAVSAISGLLTERFGCRTLALVGMVITALGLLISAVASTAPQIYLCYGALVGLGTGLAYVPAFAAVQRWFVTWRGLASGIAASGIGVGTFLIYPLTELLSSFGDWRAAFAICGIMVAVVGTLGASLLSNSPEQFVGEQPDDVKHPGLPSTNISVMALQQAVRSGSFARMYCGVLLVSLPVALPYADLASSAVSDGFKPGQAMILISILGLGSIIGRLVVAFTADRFGLRQLFLACCVGLAVATAVWANGDGFIFHGFAFSFGAFYGGFVALLPTFTADNFGRHNAASVMGLIYTSRAVGGLLGPPAVALLVAASHGYRLPLVAVSGIAGIGSYLLIHVRPLLIEV